MAAGVTLSYNLVIGLLYEGTLGDREFKMVNLFNFKHHGSIP